jgi:3-hydroxymyristoyl/3-hydroxydecanoyl-(acyl carrier protein) dehydratase
VSEPAQAGAAASLVFPPGHPVFAGHFPQAPIVPGAALLVAALQAIEATQAPARERPGGPGALRHHIAALKFFRPVRPGEALSLLWTHAVDGSMHFEWRIGSERIASGSISAISPGVCHARETI